MPFDPYHGIDFAAFAESDWTNTPTAKTQGKWRNNKTGRIVYSKTNPGVGKAGSKPADQAGAKPAATPKPPAAKTAPKAPKAPAAPKPDREAAKTQALTAASDLVGKIKGGDKSPEAAQQLIDHLTKLTVPQLKQLRDQHGLKCPAKLKAEIVAHMSQAIGTTAGTPAPEPAPQAAPAPPAPPATAPAPKPMSLDPNERFIPWGGGAKGRVTPASLQAMSAAQDTSKKAPPVAQAPWYRALVGKVAGAIKPKAAAPAPAPKPDIADDDDFSLDLDKPAPPKPETSDEYIARRDKEIEAAGKTKPATPVAETPNPVAPAPEPPKPSPPPPAAEKPPEPPAMKPEEPVSQPGSAPKPPAKPAAPPKEPVAASSVSDPVADVSKHLDDLYKTGDGFTFDDIEHAIGRMESLSPKQARQVMTDFGIRTRSGISKSKAIAEVRRKLEELIGSNQRVAPIGRTPEENKAIHAATVARSHGDVLPKATSTVGNPSGDKTKDAKAIVPPKGGPKPNPTARAAPVAVRPAPGAKPNKPASPSGPQAKPSLDDIAAVAKQSLATADKQTSPTARGNRFHDNKVFLHHVRDAIKHKYPAMSNAEVDQQILEANRAHKIHLGRADMVSAMHPDDVAESEIPYMNATFHFLLDEAGNSQKKKTNA